MACLEKRNKNLYRLRWIENGERKQKTFTADSYKDALDSKHQKEEELLRMKSSNLRLTEIWHLYKQARPRRNNEKHEEAFIKRAIEFFSDCFLYEITEKSINEYKIWLLKQTNKNYKKKKVLLSSTYANACLKKLQALWNFGRQQRLINRENDIFLEFKFPPENKREFVLSPREFNHLYETTKNENPLYAEFMKLLIQTGWRRGELAKLQWKDIYDKHIVLRSTKGKGQDDYYPYFSFVKSTLQRIFKLQKRHSKYIWADEKGRRLAQVTITRMVSRYMKKAGFPEGAAHTLRHSFATNAQANGLTIYEANLLLRQSSIRMTERYTHLIPDQIDERKVDFLRREEPTYDINNEKYMPYPFAPNIFQSVE
ncbi:MAG: site-specific integrase [Calditrichia bacterium]|nr:site-specific integrase [Calditrichia bacterium]